MRFIISIAVILAMLLVFRGIMKKVFKVSGIIFEIEYNYKLADVIFEPYTYNGSENVEEFITVTKEDKAYELSVSETSEPAIIEVGCILRKYAEICFTKHSALVFHASAIKYNGGAYLFTATSGTGKSTHTLLLKELLKDKVEFINDDKPTIKFDSSGEITVYGNPWCGKHMRGGNISAPLKGIIKLERGKENSVTKVSELEMLPILFEQSYKSKNLNNSAILLDYFTKLLKGVKLYKLTCNKDISAAECTFNNILSKWGFYEN